MLAKEILFLLQIHIRFKINIMDSNYDRTLMNTLFKLIY